MAEPASATSPANQIAAWGNNSDGQSTVPDGLTGITAIDAGAYHSVALQNGAVAAWGNNTFGQTSLPDGLTNITAISAGGFHNLALHRDGTVSAWGYNGDEQATVPDGLTNITAISAGSAHNLALRSDGTVIAWGANFYRQASVPNGLTDITAISAGRLHSLALHRDGTVTAWGYNDYGQTSVPDGLTDITAIAAGDYHSLALHRDGTVTAWGTDFYGQASVPNGLTDVTAISAGYYHNLATGDRPALTADAPPATATVGEAFTYTFTSTSSTATFEVATGSLPLGLNLSPAGVLSGTPTTEQSSTFTIAARNAFGTTTGTLHIVTVTPAPVPPTITGDPAGATVGAAYDFTYTTSGTPTPSTSIVSGTLPPGLALDDTGRLSGTPTTTGTSTFTVQAESTAGTATTTSTITVTPTPVAPTIVGDIAAGTVGVAYDSTYTYIGTPTPTISVRSGTLPPGLTLDETGRVTGTPTMPGTYTFTVQATNAAGISQATSTITIAPAPIPPTITGYPTGATVGATYYFRYTVTGFPTPSVSVQSGTLPPGLIIDEAGGLTGIPTTAGTYTFTVQAENAATTAVRTSTIVVASAPVAPTLSGVVAAGVVGSAYDYTYTVTGTPAPTVTLQSGTLPPGLALDPVGRLTGTPTKAGTYTFTVQAANTAGTVQASSTLTVSPQKVATKADLRVNLSGPSTAVKGKTYTYTLTTKNTGPATSTSVYSKVILPTNTQFVSATGKYTRIGNLVIFQRSSLTNGQSVTEKITVKITTAGKGTALATTFSVKTPDPAISSNADTTTTR